MKHACLANQRSKSRHAAATVEFALTVPIVFLFFFAGVEFARASILRHVVDNAAYEACRVVIVPGATKSEAEASAQSLLNTFGINGATITITPDPIAVSTAQVTVRVTAPVSASMWGTPRFLAASTLTSQTTLITERTPGIQATALP